MKLRLIAIAGCLILGLIVFSGMAYASVPKATVYISGSSVIAVDGQSNVISRGTLGTDDATVIQAALNALDKTDSVLTISSGTYVIDKTIVISGFTGLTVNAKGATIKMKDSYAGSYDDQYYGVYVVDCPSFKLYGLILDGNYPGQTADSTVINFNHVNDGYVYDITVKQARYKGLAIRRGESTNLTFDYCHFANNGPSPVVNANDVYCSPAADGVHSTSTYTFKNCDWSKPSRTWGGGQAFYVQSGTGYYYNNTFTRMQKVYDFRNGVHTVLNAYGTDCGMALITYDGSPTVNMTNAYFNGLSGSEIWHDQVGGIWLTRGTTTIDNATIISTGNSDSMDGIRIDGTYSTIGSTTVRNCKISGFVYDGIAITGTTGGHTLTGNTITNCASYGIRSEGNTGTTTASGNVITGVTTPYNNADGKLVIQSTATPTPTPKPTATPTPTPKPTATPTPTPAPTATPTPTTHPQVPTPTPTPTATISLVTGWNLISIPLAPQDNSVTALLPASVTSGLTSVWGWDEVKQNWAYYSPDPNDGFYKSYPAITKLETGRAYWIQMNKSASFTVTGTVPSGAPGSPIALVSGWNFVGPTGQTASTPSVMYPKALAVWGWDAAKQNWVYYSPDPNDGFYQTYPKITSIQLGQGYWVEMA